MRVEGDNHVLIFRSDMGPMQCTGVAAGARSYPIASVH
ncbi:hypothetical protein AZ54_22805 [Xanthomonas oryzae pv. oryzae PXO86]|uniref:Uncharacterized protein n=1 Tax=Xanthomonas oryzae pv. oryzae (strain PXO99A) TaxID=360094 RepID=A0A0K0GQW9_XANOP|nr:hypothetical protein PXO_05772 [Xanthomonas oryzae pv. oryzae PXO99A]AJQ85069.1 hypothetical protein AZ54_22805 [Xanthomonas oryzae pv. oryzae PXO86]